MPMPLTKAEVEAIARNPNVTAAIERLAEEYVTNRDMRTRTKSTIARERELLTDVDKAVWIAVENASRPVPTDIRPAVGGGGGAAGPGRVIGRDTTIVLTMDGRAKPPHVPSDVHRALERLVYDDPPGSDGDGKAWWGWAVSPDRLRALYAVLKLIPHVPPPVVAHATEASARAMVEACGLPWVTPRAHAAEPPTYPLSGWDVRAAIALDVGCGGDVVVLTGDEVTGS